MAEVMRSIEDTMTAYHQGDHVTDAELLQARIALEELGKAAGRFGSAMRPVAFYANLTASNIRSIEFARGEKIKAGKPTD